PAAAFFSTAGARARRAGDAAAGTGELRGRGRHVLKDKKSFSFNCICPTAMPSPPPPPPPPQSCGCVGFPPPRGNAFYLVFPFPLVCFGLSQPPSPRRMRVFPRPWSASNHRGGGGKEVSPVPFEASTESFGASSLAVRLCLLLAMMGAEKKKK
ncbi:MAG: hypothetical protein BJ554DRAFT_6670, partial [Olpidium bornovanus]